jgi:hypothetical protein
MKLGISFEGAGGIGDKVQFTSFPENYHVATGKTLIDVDRVWCLDHNPYIVRDEKPDKIINPWETPLPPHTPFGRPTWHSIAERTMVQFGLDPKKAVLRHPRLYRFEDAPKHHRVVVHTTGYSTRGKFSPEVTNHVRQKYRDWEIVQVGAKDDVDFPADVDIRGADLWKVAETIAGSELFIGVCSGPGWISAAYPSVWSKKLLMHMGVDQLVGPLTPMATYNKDWHWYDHSFIYYNRTEHDLGFTYSYKKL